MNKKKAPQKIGPSSRSQNKAKTSDLESLIQKYYNASGNEKKLLLAIIKRKKPNFKE